MRHLSTFVCNPALAANISRIPLVNTRSCCLAAVKSITSSAYRNNLSLTNGSSLWKRFWESASLTRALRASIANTNNKGDNGSPCRSPRAWQMRRPGKPLQIILMLEEERIMEIQFTHLLEKPMWDNSSKRKGQLSESNALEISIFSKAQVVFFSV